MSVLHSVPATLVLAVGVTPPSIKQQPRSKRPSTTATPLSLSSAKPKQLFPPAVPFANDPDLDLSLIGSSKSRETKLLQKINTLKNENAAAYQHVAELKAAAEKEQKKQAMPVGFAKKIATKYAELMSIFSNQGKSPGAFEHRAKMLENAEECVKSQKKEVVEAQERLAIFEHKLIWYHEQVEEDRATVSMLEEQDRITRLKKAEEATAKAQAAEAIEKKKSMIRKDKTNSAKKVVEAQARLDAIASVASNELSNLSLTSSSTTAYTSPQSTYTPSTPYSNSSPPHAVASISTQALTFSSLTPARSRLS
jgi:hypothetical protein